MAERVLQICEANALFAAAGTRLPSVWFEATFRRTLMHQTSKASFFHALLSASLRSTMRAGLRKVGILMDSNDTIVLRWLTTRSPRLACCLWTSIGGKWSGGQPAMSTRFSEERIQASLPSSSPRSYDSDRRDDGESVRFYDPALVAAACRRSLNERVLASLRGDGHAMRRCLCRPSASA